MAVVKNDFPGFLSRESDGRSALGGNQRHRNVIAGFDGISRPAVPAKNAGTLRFDGPTYHVAFRVFDVKIDLAMGIGPHEFRYVPCDGGRMLFVVSHISMVRFER